MSDILTSMLSLEYEGRPVRIVWRGGEPWWAAKDICDVLSLTDPNKTLDRLPNEEKGTNSVRTLGGNQALLIISEPGLFRLIFTSRKPEAEAFKQWIFREVLPTIRRAGMFALDPVEADRLAAAHRIVLRRVFARTNDSQDHRRCLEHDVRDLIRCAVRDWILSPKAIMPCKADFAAFQARRRVLEDAIAHIESPGEAVTRAEAVEREIEARLREEQGDAFEPRLQLQLWEGLVE